MSSGSKPIGSTSRAASLSASAEATQVRLDRLRSVTGRTAPAAEALADAIEQQGALREAAGRPTATKRDLDAFERADDVVSEASRTYREARRHAAHDAVVLGHRGLHHAPRPKSKHKG